MMLASPRYDASLDARVREEITTHGSWHGEIWLRAKSGEEVPVWCNVSVVFDAEGKTLNIIIQTADLRERKAAEARIESLATRDQMTGLPNRQGFVRILDAWLATGRGGALLIFDLDHLGRVNDAFGHESGDSMLRTTGQRLRRLLREDDALGRLGGDQFGVLTAGRSDAEAVETVVRKLLDAIAQPMPIDGSAVVSTACAGICLFPADGTDSAALLRNADAAMHRAKAGGANQFRFFALSMNEEMAERLRLESDLRGALDRSEFLLHYQPQYELAGQRPIGVECLLRWRHPELGVVPPSLFIPLAEETRLILQIGRWVLIEACRQNRAWQDAGLPPCIVAVNLSALQFHDGSIVDQVSEALVLSGLDPRWLELEITESVIMHDPEHVAALLGRLKALGVRLSIDDFGTGYSSLAYLKRFPLDKIKIDRSFVTDLEHDPNDAAIVRMVIGIAKELELKVIAEGVETEGQRDFLHRHACDEVQGFLFSRPLPVEAIPAILAAA
jgi:diguanylate cyclase (GGDEF)-like protein